jgi:hypothetical protein
VDQAVGSWPVTAVAWVQYQAGPCRIYVVQSGSETGCSPSRGQLKCDGTRPETRFRLSAKQTSPFKSAGASVQSTAGSRGVRISGSNAGYTTFRGSVKSTGYPLHSPVSPSLPLPCVTVCHHVSTGISLVSCFATVSFIHIYFICYRRWKGEQLTLLLTALSFCLIRI